MQKLLIALFVCLLGATAAHAGCYGVSGPCATDSGGNTYTTQQNLNGGYSTYSNGSRYSSTGQTLDGYQENFVGGGSRQYNYDPSPYSSRSSGPGSFR